MLVYEAQEKIRRNVWLFLDQHTGDTIVLPIHWEQLKTLYQEAFENRSSFAELTAMTRHRNLMMCYARIAMELRKKDKIEDTITESDFRGDVLFNGEDEYKSIRQ